MVVDCRDLRTVGPLIPEARTKTFPIGDAKGVVGSVCAERFVCIASAREINFFATDGPSSVMASEAAGPKKGTTPILGGAGVEPCLLTLTVPTEDGDILSVSLAFAERFLIVATANAVLFGDLTSWPIELKRIELDLVLGELFFAANIVPSAVVGGGNDTLVVAGKGKDGTARVHGVELIHENGSIATGKVKEDLIPKHGSSDGSRAGCHIDVQGQMVAVCVGNHEVFVWDHFSITNDAVPAQTSLSTQCGEVGAIRVIAKGSIVSQIESGLSGVVVLQRDVISIFKLVPSDDSLELVFQFRDSISKIAYRAMDLRSQYLVVSSVEGFGGRDRFELYDLSMLKVKSASLTPLRRWDVSRISSNLDEPNLFFLTGISRVLRFVSCIGPSVVEWAPVVKDHWYPFMANFEVLNKNEPYIEKEEEFDFNQNADPHTVRTSINRYKRTDNLTFDFVLPTSTSTASQDVAMDEPLDGSIQTPQDKPMLYYPFMSPLDTWRKCGNIEKSNFLDESGVKAEFFGSACSELLRNCVKRI